MNYLNLKLSFKLFITCTFVYSLLFYIVFSTLFWRTGKTKQSTNAGDEDGIQHVIVHLDLKGAPPKLSYLTSLLPILRNYGATGLLIEYEDMFPFDGRLYNITATNHYEKSELTLFLKKASSLGYTIIPLVQTFGHLEMLLKFAEYRDMRENDNYPDSVCPSNKDALQTLYDMLDQVIIFHESISPLRYIHIGCDEVYHLNMCDKCQARGLTNEELFLEHIIKISSTIKNKYKNKTVLIWDDMLRGIKPNILQTYEIHKYIEPIVWSYNPNINIPYHVIYKYFNNFKNVWAASAFKGANLQTSVLPDIENRYNNNINWLKYMLTYKIASKEIRSFKGIFLTGWSRFHHFGPLCELLPNSMPSLILNLLLYRHNSRFPDINIDNNFPIDVSRLFSNVMNCDDYLSLDSLDNELVLCKFSERDLYTIMLRLNKTQINLGDFLLRFTFDVSENMKYYQELNNVSPIRLNGIENELITLKMELNYLKQALIKYMDRYYDEFTIDEYVKYKIDGMESIVDGIIYNVSKVWTIKSWNRRP